MGPVEQLCFEKFDLRNFPTSLYFLNIQSCQILHCSFRGIDKVPTMNQKQKSGTN